MKLLTHVRKPLIYSNSESSDTLYFIKPLVYLDSECSDTLYFIFSPAPQQPAELGVYTCWMDGQLSGHQTPNAVEHCCQVMGFSEMH